MANKRVHLIVMAFLFLLVSGLRIGQALISKGSDWDNHMEICQKMLSNEALPKINDCRECFHPMFYHLTVAIAWIILGPSDDMRKLVIGQMTSAIASIVALIFLWLLLEEFPVRSKAKVFAFLLIGLNPCLFQMNGIFTNDSFSIFFSTMALYFLYKFLSEPKSFSFWMLLLASVATVLSKANSIVTVAVIIVAFIIKAIVLRKTESFLAKKYLLFAAVFIGLFMGVAYFQFYTQATNAKTFSPIGPSSTFHSTPWRDHHEGDYISANTIPNSFFTFRFIDLLIHPYGIPGQHRIPWHMTSLWTQIYARTHSIFMFGKIGNLTVDAGDWYKNFNRGLFALALFPTILVLYGLFKQLFYWHKAWKMHQWDFVTKDSSWIFGLVVLGYLAFLYIFEYGYRLPSGMDPRFTFPGLLGVGYFLAVELESFYVSIKNRWVVIISDLSILALLVLYAISIWILIYNLATQSYYGGILKPGQY